MQNEAMAWDDPIEHDGAGFVLLPPGVYPFTVTGLEKLVFKGSDKLPPNTPQAKLTVRIDGGEHGAATVEHNLFLSRATEWTVCAFFVAIGLRSHGERIVPNWGAVVGATGYCRVGTRKWKGRDGTERDANDIKAFLDPAEVTPAEAVAPAAAPAAPTTDDKPTDSLPF
ncbi:MAG: hypothetical protein KA760_14910 [Steroidobacteraceae bacterium]|nr:hypothetical protein [Steroidobacteraceae bacterium]